VHSHKRYLRGKVKSCHFTNPHKIIKRIRHKKEIFFLWQPLKVVGENAKMSCSWFPLSCQL